MQRRVDQYLLGMAAVPVAAESSAMLIVPQLAGVMNIFVGLMLTGGILFGVGGFIEYISHLGLQERDAGLEHMKLGIGILFTLALLLWLAQFVQSHVPLVITLLGAGVIFMIAWLFISEYSKPAAPEKPEKK